MTQSRLSFLEVIHRHDGTFPAKALNPVIIDWLKTIFVATHKAPVLPEDEEQEPHVALSSSLKRMYQTLDGNSNRRYRPVHTGRSPVWHPFCEPSPQIIIPGFRSPFAVREPATLRLQHRQRSAPSPDPTAVCDQVEWRCSPNDTPSLRDGEYAHR